MSAAPASWMWLFTLGYPEVCSEGKVSCRVAENRQVLCPFEGGHAQGLVGGYVSRVQALFFLLLYLWFVY